MTLSTWPNRFYSFLLSPSYGRGDYAFVVLRIIMGYTWLVRDIPRWTALSAGNPIMIPANTLRKNLPQLAMFGTGNSVTFFYLFTAFETVAAILLILGLATRLAALWGVIEFFVNGTTGLLIGSLGLQEDYGLFGLNLLLLLYGSRRLSIDGLIAKRGTKSVALGPRS